MQNDLEKNTNTEYGYVKDGKVYLKAYSTFEDRQIGDVKTTDEEALAYFIRRFEFITGKVQALLDDIENAVNKGSYLMKLLHMRGQLETYDALGDFMPLFAKLDEAEDTIRGLIDNNRVKNFEIKQALLQEWRENLGTIADWMVASAKAKEIREKWLKTGSVAKEHEEETEGAFEQELNIFFQTRKVYFDERQRIMMERVEKYAQITASARALAAPDQNPWNSFKTLNILSEEWKAIGPVPKVHFEPLIKQFKQYKRSIMYALKKQKMEKERLKPVDPVLIENLARKEAMIQEVKGYEQIDLRIAFAKTKELQNVWRDIGNVPEHLKNDINNKFTYHCDRIFEMSYLMRTVYIQNRFFNSKPIKEQYSIKIQMLRDIIRKDEVELHSMEGEFNLIPEHDRRSPNHKPLYNKLNTQKRKLRVKYKLVEEMQTQLSALS
jgi:hypothetical protein